MQVCAAKGYHATRVDDIAAAAGLSKGAVYHHFATKQEIFLGLMEMMTEQAATMVDQLEQGGSDTAHTTRASLRYFLDMVEQAPELVRGMMELFGLGLRETPFRDRLTSYYDRLIGAYERVLRHGMERGEVKSDIDPAAMARMFVTSGDGCVFVHMLLEQPQAAVASVLVLTETLLRAILVTYSPEAVSS